MPFCWRQVHNSKCGAKDLIGPRTAARSEQISTAGTPMNPALAGWAD